MADEKKAQRDYDDAVRAADAEHACAANALKSGDEAAARKFLASEQKIREGRLAMAEKTLAAAKACTLLAMMSLHRSKIPAMFVASLYNLRYKIGLIFCHGYHSITRSVLQRVLLIILYKIIKSPIDILQPSLSIPHMLRHLEPELKITPVF